MSRAGLVALQAEAPPHRNPDETDEAWEERNRNEFERYASSAVVQLNRGDLTDSAVWDSLVERVRTRTRISDMQSLDLMLDAIRRDSDVAQIVQKAYSVRVGLGGSEFVITPQLACGGCAYDRLVGQEPYCAVSPAPPPIQWPHVRVSEELQRLVGGSYARERTLTVFYPASSYGSYEWLRQCDDVVKTSVRHGIRIVAAPQNVLNRQVVQTAHRTIEDAYILVVPASGYPSFSLPNLPTLVIWPVTSLASSLPNAMYADYLPLRILLIPSDTRDAERPDVSIESTRHPNMSVDAFLGRL
jgi:hypothetical protein